MYCARAILRPGHRNKYINDTTSVSILYVCVNVNICWPLCIGRKPAAALPGKILKKNKTKIKNFSYLLLTKKRRRRDHLEFKRQLCANGGKKKEPALMEAAVITNVMAMLMKADRIER